MRNDTKCIHAGYTPKNGEPRMIPIIESTTFKYDSSAAMGDLFDLKAAGYFYSRLQNPTCDMVAAKLAALPALHRGRAQRRFQAEHQGRLRRDDR